MKRTMTCLALLAVWFSPALAEGGWLGQPVTADWYVPDNVTILESHNLVVGPGVELPFGSIANGGNLAIDVSDIQVRFEFSSLAIWSPATVNGWQFSDTPGAVPNIVGVSLGPMSPGVSGLTNAALSFTANSILGNFVGVTAAGAGDFYTINVKFANTPEPGGLTLAAFGAAGFLAWGLRRKASRAN